MALFKSLRIYRDSDGLIEYMGRHAVQGISTSAAGWYVWKFNRDSDGKITYIDGPICGVLDNRVNMDWGS